MLSLRYIERIREILRMYKRGEYEVIGSRERKNCNVCLRRKQGEILCFYFSSGDSEQEDFFHRECLEELLNEENFKMFLSDKVMKIARLREKIQSRNN